VGLEPSRSINLAARRSIDEAKTAVAPPFFYASSIFGGFKSGSWLKFTPNHSGWAFFFHFFSIKT
jgi:hypothetical protein